jgi:cyanophycin synthetase
MQLNHEAIYHGPNPHADEPVIVARLRLGPGTAGLEAGCSRLRELYPEWLPGDDLPSRQRQPARSGIPRPSGRWPPSTKCAAACAAPASPRRTTGSMHPPDQGVDIYLAYHHAPTSRQALELALKVIAAAAGNPAFSRKDLQAVLQTLWQDCRRHHPDWQARILMQGARSRDIPVLPLVDGSKHWQYGWGKRARIFFETSSNADGYLGGVSPNRRWRPNRCSPHWASRRRAMSWSPRKPTWTGRCGRSAGPCVVKPMDMGSGKGVTAGIATGRALLAAFRNARRYTRTALMMEAHCPGTDYRLFMLDGRLIAAVRREPSSVTGDGVRSVRQLIDELNAARSGNMLRSRYLVPVEFDGLLSDHLAAHGAHLDTVLPRGRQMTLRSNANRSTGGVSHDVLELVHPQVRAMAERLAEVTGLHTPPGSTTSPPTSASRPPNPADR